jgi:hypothetical protein
MARIVRFFPARTQMSVYREPGFVKVKVGGSLLPIRCRDQQRRNSCGSRGKLSGNFKTRLKLRPRLKAIGGWLIPPNLKLL